MNQSLRRRLQESVDVEVLLATLNEEETDFAIRSRHHEEPMERNVFVRTAPSIPNAPSPTSRPSATPVSPAPVSPATASPAPTTPPSTTPAPAETSEGTMEPSAFTQLDTNEPSPTPSIPPTGNLTRAPSESEPPSSIDTPGPSSLPPNSEATLAPSMQPSLSTIPSVGSGETLAPAGGTLVTSAPSTSPAPSSSAAPSGVLGELTLEEFLFQSLTDDGSLTLSGTPQNRAFVTLTASNPDLDPNDQTDQQEISQRYALNTLYFSTDGDNWANNVLWTSADPPCGGESTDSWHGVNCDDTLQSVEGISLSLNDLVGQLTSEIRGIPSLRKYRKMTRFSNYFL
jgi:hypothetical protein